ncbi:MAG: branched-chain amino acid ABC transporter permease [Chloroflexi bacterium CG15_BIG_FIL_POST_REV_8_21_14_020_46_15]|nr:MAG: branched-chain amino acid ABC transporter permease [Dehalococcoidia bacterium CG2_30_46_19]PIW40348.1 MAG: branched-chain amino acid ABC transporter permease [Chloroflexi bacterium CG15_BIG_FIL_POST_REV_8_21_14_020_46_15]
MLLYGLDFLVFVGIFGIVALSLNLEFGFAGIANFGKVAFFLIGAYTYALLSKIGIPFPLCLIAGALTSALFGLLISLPALRLRTDYLAIAILAFGEILRLIVKSESWIAGGDWGTSVAPAISIAGASHHVGVLVNIGLVYFCLLICFVIAQLLANSPYGRVVRAIREDEIAAEALGKDRAKYKAQILMIGSAMVGVAGGLYVQYLHYVLPDMFVPMITFTVWIMVLLGGPGNNWGALLGAGLVELFKYGTNLAKPILPLDPINLQYILFGVLIILVLFYRPQGLLKESPIKTKALELVRYGKGVVNNKAGK